MTYPRLRERTLEMVEDALVRTLAFGETVDAIDFALTVAPTPQGMAIVGMLHVSLKGPVLGTTLGNVDMCPDLGALSSQEFIDDRVRICLEAVRQQRAQQLIVTTNGG